MLYFTGHSCSKEEFKCDNLQCVKGTQKCDGRSHCLDGSDERNCKCLSHQFACLSGVCLSPEKLRDGEKDCEDGEDEKEGHGKNTINFPLLKTNHPLIHNYPSA